jgi:hypothetical protein
MGRTWLTSALDYDGARTVSAKEAEERVALAAVTDAEAKDHRAAFLFDCKIARGSKKTQQSTFGRMCSGSFRVPTPFHQGRVSV